MVIRPLILYSICGHSFVALANAVQLFIPSMCLKRALLTFCHLQPVGCNLKVILLIPQIQGLRGRDGWQRHIPTDTCGLSLIVCPQFQCDVSVSDLGVMEVGIGPFDSPLQKRISLHVLPEYDNNYCSSSSGKNKIK